MIKTTLSQKEYDSDLKVTEKYKIICTDCGKYLGNIAEIETIGKKAQNIPMKHICYCFCGNECFLITTKKQTCVLLEGNYTVTEISTDGGLTKVKIGRVK